MKIITGGVTKAKGFKASGISAGIKRSGKPDLGLILSENVAVSAAVFTKNSIKAAPVVVTQKNIKHNKAKAVIVNSGNANCFTGKTGMLHAKQSTELIGNVLNISPKHVIVASTGIIGRPLPFEKIVNATPKLIKELNIKNNLKFAKSILTTDLITKEVTVETNIGGKKVVVGGCGKGSGMIAPNMATMLGFITTDAAISAQMLKLALKNATEKSFNSITVDGCMSTNDMVCVLANGQAKNRSIKTKGKDFEKFCEALDHVCIEMSKMIVLDAEGATKFITINVANAKNDAQAKTVALSVANSMLVKTAAFGSNPNWGRVAAAAGSLGIKEINEENIKIKFSPFDKKEISITVDLRLGKGKATVYTSDLSYEYVRINGEYN